MKNRFTKKIAKEIALRNFDTTLDCLLGIQDPDYNLDTDVSELEQNFTEDLEEMNITVTPKRIEIINNYYKQKREKVQAYLNKQYSKKL